MAPVLMAGAQNQINEDYDSDPLGASSRSSVEGNCSAHRRRMPRCTSPPSPDLLVRGFFPLVSPACSLIFTRSGLPDASSVSVRALKPLRFQSPRPPSHHRSSRRRKPVFPALLPGGPTLALFSLFRIAFSKAVSEGGALGLTSLNC